MVEIHAWQQTLQVRVVILSSSFSFFITNINDYNDYCNHYYIENPEQTPEQILDLNKRNFWDSL